MIIEEREYCEWDVYAPYLHLGECLAGVGDNGAGGRYKIGILCRGHFLRMGSVLFV